MKKLISFLLIFVFLVNFTFVSQEVNAVDNKNTAVSKYQVLKPTPADIGKRGSGVELDEVYDPSQPIALLDSDDFEKESDYISYLKEYDAYDKYVAEKEQWKEKKIAQSGSKNITSIVTPTVQYKFNLTRQNAIQSFCVYGSNIYIAQNYYNITFNGSTYSDKNMVLISKCSLNSSGFYTADSSMLLFDVGHGQSLDVYSHTYNGQTHTYLLISCGKYQPAGETYYWSTQIGRIEYSANSTLNNSSIKRLTHLNYSNNTGTSFGATKRVDFAVSTNNNYLLIWKRSQSGSNQFSGYSFSTINACFDSSSSNTISFLSNSQLLNACTFTFNNPSNMPTSVQGLELSNLASGLHSIYITSGNEAEFTMNYKNYIYRYNSAGTYKNSIQINDTGLWTDYGAGSSYNAVAEIEGCKISGDYLNFLIRDTSDSYPNRQVIAKVNKSVLQ